MKQFEVGKRYYMRSICNHDAVWTYEVLKRTAKTITITDGKETMTRRILKNISEYCGCETVEPLGHYSMSPTLRSEKEM